MKAFIKNYWELTSADLKGLRKNLVNHQAIQAMMAQFNITATVAVDETLAAWQQGEITPLHDNRGNILGFRPVRGDA